MKNIKLGNASIPITEYASQGNAVLGIRDSGKSYSATYLAEQLLEAGIPFVAFDPIGIWKYLRVPGKGKGYPVVVAGGRNGDLPLTPQSAPEIVRAAMRENIPLVIDLYDMRLSKADWKQIVEQSVRLLLYENGDHGLRHIFIEEAAEFAPQRIGPDQGRVYAEIEKLARMGGNARLGYTLINQRSEEVNKAILELCDCLFLHRQKGRNSLTNLGKWLDIGSVDAGKEIIKSLPLLGQGECWVWTAGNNIPVRVQMPQKNSFHPDRRATLTGTQGKDFKALDVSSFVQQMSGTLEKHLQTVKENDPAELKKRIKQLEAELKKAQSQVIIPPQPAMSKEDLEQFGKAMDSIKSLLSSPDEIKNILDDITQRMTLALQGLSTVMVNASRQIENNPKLWLNVDFTSRIDESVNALMIGKEIIKIENKNPLKLSRATGPMSEGITNPQQRIIDSIAWLETVGLFRPKRTVIAFLAGQSPKSSGYTNNLGSLRSMRLLSYPDSDSVELTDDGRKHASPQQKPATTQELQYAILSRLPGPQANILSYLIRNYPYKMDRDVVASAAGQSPTSSGYTNNLGALRSLGVIDYPDSKSVVALPILFLE